MKKILISSIWISSLIIAVLYTYENPDRIDAVKFGIKQYLSPKVESKDESVERVIGNFFAIDFSREVSFSEKTAFITYNEEDFEFDKKNLKIYFQNGYISKNFNIKKIDLPKNFTLRKNGGVKTVMTYEEKEFALISSKKNDCFYASIIMIENSKEIFNLDYNGIGSSFVHYDEKILLSIGAPEQISSEISEFAQDENSFYGKIIEIKGENLKKIISNEEKNLSVNIFSTGHRNPQGFTKIKDFLFSVEHGPKGGDELNRIIKGKNYGWPKVSYGRKYDYDKELKSYEISHEKNQFEEPLFAFNPSIGISALNKCPLKLNDFYQKPCLIALSLYGNDLMPGKSVIIFLLNEKMDKVHSVEKIFLREDLKLRHFVTNSKNELYEDEEGNIYVSADRKGIYKLNFTGFIK